MVGGGRRLYENHGGGPPGEGVGEEEEAEEDGQSDEGGPLGVDVPSFLRELGVALRPEGGRGRWRYVDFTRERIYSIALKKLFIA